MHFEMEVSEKIILKMKSIKLINRQNTFKLLKIKYIEYKYYV